jgi:hypothetical protein
MRNYFILPSPYCIFPVHRIEPFALAQSTNHIGHEYFWPSHHHHFTFFSDHGHRLIIICCCIHFSTSRALSACASSILRF